MNLRTPLLSEVRKRGAQNTQASHRGMERAECGSLRPDHRNEGWAGGDWDMLVPEGHLQQDNCSPPETRG